MFGEILRRCKQVDPIRAGIFVAITALCVGTFVVLMRPSAGMEQISSVTDNSAQAAPAYGKTKTASKLIPVIEKKTVFDITDLPYETKRVDDASLAVGTETVRSAGKQGRRVATYEATLVNGNEVARTLVSDLVTFQPVDEIIAVGTQTKRTCAFQVYLLPNSDAICFKRDKKSRWDWL